MPQFKGDTKGLTTEDIDGIAMIQDNTDLILEALDTAIANALEKIGLLAERYAKENLRINKSIVTGRLRNSITHTTDGKDVYIGTNVEYAKYVEYGTSKQKPKPYLRPAATEHLDEYKQIMKDALEGD